MSLCFWLMMQSTAIAVLPMARSPMINSRWPRPSANMASMTSSPVCTGWLTKSRSMIGGRRTFDGLEAFRNDGVAAVKRTAKRIDNATEKFADRPARARLRRCRERYRRLRPRRDRQERRSREHRDRAWCKPDLAALETHQLAEPDIGQSGDIGNAVGNPFDPADLLRDRPKRRRFDAPAGVAEPGLELRQHAGHGLRSFCRISLRMRSRSARQLLRMMVFWP